MLVGLVAAATLVTAVLFFSLSALSDSVESAVVLPDTHTELSDDEARNKMAELFDIHIPENWRLAEMTETCRNRMNLPTCTYDGMFEGPATEFARYPELFRGAAVARPVTCEVLAAKNLLDLVPQTTCTNGQSLVLHELAVGRAVIGSSVLVAGSATTTDVRIRIRVV